MNRRRFLQMSVCGAAATLQLAQCANPNETGQPRFLKAALGEAIVKDIGKLYIERFPLEADPKKLSTLITIPNGQSDTPIIKGDFTHNKVVELNGWILSVTEARQAALYYINT